MNVLYTSRSGRYLKLIASCLFFIAASVPGRLLAQCTTPGVVTVAPATNIGCSSFTANWNTPTGTVTNYSLDVSTSPDFSSHVAGYPVLTNSTATFYSVTGLSQSYNYYYQVKAINVVGASTCTATYSNSDTVTTQANSFTCECTPAGDLVCAADYLSNVTVNTLNNSSGCSTGGYTYYSPIGSQTTNLALGNTYTMTVTTGGTGVKQHSAGFWIDYPRSGTLVPADYTNISSTLTAGSTFSRAFTVPNSGVSTGFAAMRVRYGIGAPSVADPCTVSVDSGETEDYTVCMYKPTVVTLQPTNTLSCVGATPSLLIAATGSSLTYQWYKLADTGWAAISGATTASYNPSSPPPGVYYFKCNITNVCGIVTQVPTTGLADTLTVNAVPTIGSVTASPSILCIGTPVTLTANSVTGTGTLISYNWSGPGLPGGTATSLTNTYTFYPSSSAASGTYNGSVTFQGNGCSSSTLTSGSVNVNGVPTIGGFTVSANPACANSPLTFTAGSSSGTGAISSYNWSGPGLQVGTGATTIVTTTTNVLTFNPVSQTTAAGVYSLSISYVGVGCTSGKDTSLPIQIDTAVAAITGNAFICVNQTTTFSNTTPVGTGGGWVSTNTGVATIDPVSGTATGLTAGTTTIAFIATNGCGTTFSNVVLTVNPLPNPILGAGPVCTGNTISLTESSSTPGGVWNASLTAAAVDPSGNVTGNAVVIPTPVGITYTLPITGCKNSTTVTVNPLPAPITGNRNVCLNQTSPILSDATVAPSGTWSTTDGTIATIGTDGTVTGVSLGSTTVTYTLAGTGCITTTNVTVNPLPAAIVGTYSVCASLTTVLTDATTGGAWSSSSPGFGSVLGAGTTGTVTGVLSTGGITNIIYTMPSGCTATAPVTVNALSQILGTKKVCNGLITALSEATPGGTWSSSDCTIACPGTDGSVTGISVTLATATITYSLPTTCAAYATVTVNPLPAVITGDVPVCAGYNITLGETSTPGTWSSSALSIASVDPLLGIVTGNTAVLSTTTATITYTLPTGCIMTATVTVNPVPLAITGNLHVCPQLTTQLNDATTPGTWASSATSIADIGSAGLVSAHTNGTTTITYTIPTGCFIASVVTVDPLPVAITGTTNVCVGLTTTLTDGSTPGTWISSNPAIGSIDINTGVLYGVLAGSATVTYTLPTTCQITTPITVNPLPLPITGTMQVCQGLGTTLADLTSNGNWSSSNTNASIDGSGNVTGSSTLSGTATITYTLPATGCIMTTPFTVNPLPAAIGGNLNVCVQSTNHLSSSPALGTWSSSNSLIGTIDPVTGNITGIAQGTTTVTYTLNTGCIMTAIATVNPLPAAITGTMNVCVGLTTTLADITSPGAWSSSNGNATVDGSTGIVTGVTAGTVSIIYTLPTTCSVNALVTVNPLAPITGVTNICVGSSQTLSDLAAGGTWSSSNTIVATVVGSTGSVTGVNPGTATITYSLPTGCTAYTTVTVVNTLNAVTGATNVCSGLSTPLSNSTLFGTWSASPAGIITIDASGNVTGHSAGTGTVTYKLGTGCIAPLYVMTVNPLPAAITGTLTACPGLTTTVLDVTGTGTWTGGSPTVGTIDPTSGVVTAIAAGTTTVTYTIPTGCINTGIVTVNPLPSPIVGVTNICSGTSPLTDPGFTGTWSSSNASIVTIGSTGIAASVGAATGTATITFIVNGTGCTTTTNVTVVPSLNPITGQFVNCDGVPTNLSDAITGGTWSSASAFVATVGSNSGTMTGQHAGSTTITYTLGGCNTTAGVTINPLAPITGLTNICVGFTTSLSDAAPLGTWSSPDPTVTVGSGSGTILGNSVGTATIHYLISSTGCQATTNVTVVNSSTMAPIAGNLQVCPQQTVNLTAATAGGTWSSSALATGTVGSATGTVYGVAAGTTTISYSLGTGCTVTAIETVNPLPTAIAGSPYICIPTPGFTLLSDAGGGTWVSSNTAVADLGSSGVVGFTVGTSTLTYTLNTGCYTSIVVSVNSNPAPITPALGDSVCSGRAIALNDATPGGTWGTANGAIATVANFGTLGVVTGHGVVTGLVNITYIVTATTCKATQQVTVNPLPAAITGSNAVCYHSQITLADASGPGYWSSSDVTIAAVGSGTAGTVTGAGVGSTTISYTLYTGGCYATTPITVNPLPNNITGTFSVCVGYTTTLNESITPGTWSSNNTGVASVGSTGIVTGVTSGTATISYVLATGCYVVQVVTVNDVPAVVTGPTNVCVNSPITLTDATAGGTWSSTTRASVVGAGTSGTVTGVSAGSATISYTLATGCFAAYPITVNPLPANITGTLNVCVGLTTTLSDITTPGTWASGNTATATVVGSTGVVTGQSVAGTATISYSLGTGCSATAVVTVNPLPGAITGAPAVCAGSTATYSTTATGGTWTSGNNAIATIVGSTGVVTGIAGGSVTITYTLPTGCITTTTITVNPTASITGATNVCLNLTTTLHNTVTGGTWSSSNATVGSIDVASGAFTASSTAGASIITYTTATGCIDTTLVTVINTVPAITPASPQVCVGGTTTLSNTALGGAWASLAPSIGSIDPTSGIVAGIVAGTATIIYSFGGSCFISTTLTVNPVAPITGTAVACFGSSPLTLNDAITGGTWSSSNSSVATVGSTGIVTLGIAGTATITDVFPTGCSASIVVTVNPVPVISGSTVSCNGATITLTSNIPGSTWSSSNTAVATIGTSGAITGLSAGTTTITCFPLPLTGCYAVETFTVITSVPAIGGPTRVCKGSSITLTDADPGGTWTSSNANAIVNGSTGVVTGVNAGNASITYTLTSGSCRTILPITVNPLPANITGTTNVCVGLTTTLSDGAGTWMSDNTSVGTVGSTTGAVTGILAGTTNITFTLNSTGCATSTPVTVNSLPAAITGASHVCYLGSTIEADGTPGGTWNSSNNSVVYASSGATFGISVGTATISYQVTSTGCVASKIITVNALPDVITGPATVCSGSTIALADDSLGGTWSSTDAILAVAIVGTAGNVTGIAPGTVTINYTLPTGCTTNTVVTVLQSPAVITGSAGVCVGLTTGLDNTVTGGTWTSGNTAVAIIDPSGGVATGITPGTTTITYSIGDGCSATDTFTVYGFPGAITGSAGTCVGSTITLSDASSGGTWSSSNTAVASAGSLTGIVTGMGTGTAVVTYTSATGCTVNTTVNVAGAVSAITAATAQVCIGLTITLNDADPSGTWTSSNTAVATIDGTTGIVTGAGVGTTMVTYFVPSGCYATTTVTAVSAIPAITATTTHVCAGSTLTLADAAPGGSWTTSDATIASVGTSGIVSGGLPGTASISYSLGTGCAAGITITVNPVAPVTGSNSICMGSTTSLTDAVPGGTWHSSNSLVAAITTDSTVSPVTVSGMAIGSATITYTLPTGCTSVAGITVNSPGAAISITSPVCVGLTTAASDATPGGTWSSSNTSIASIGSATGVITGVNPGAATITYSFGGGCNILDTVTVNPLSPITGATNVCTGATTTLSDATGGGNWGSLSTSVATVVTGTGVVSGVSVGTAVITYTLSTGCTASTTVAVNTSGSPITVTPPICVGLTAVASETATGGTWSSSNTGVATIGSTGIITGVSPGTATISYSLGAGCSVATTITVNGLSSITGITSLGAGATTTLSDATLTGTWSSSNTAVATVGATTGVVTGIAGGTATITYMLSSGCMSTTVVTVIPGILPITGISHVCAGLSTTLSDATPGGTWSSSNTAVATVNSVGFVVGLTPGTATIDYTVGAGLTSTLVVTVYPFSQITGQSNICIGTPDTLINTTPGGVWSGGTSFASVGALTGIINTSGTIGGSTIITYTLASGCVANYAITVNPIAPVTGGNVSICVSSSATLNDAVSGGTWSSSNSAIASVGISSGIVSGLSSGSATISYIMPTGCTVLSGVTVNPLPANITGTTEVCAGATTTLSSTTTGGAWSSAATAVATVGSGNGIVTGTGYSGGTVVISYALNTGCNVTTIVTVHPLAPIGGTTNLCLNAVGNLSDAVPGGTWTSSNTAVAGINTTGQVSAFLTGTSTISYSLPFGCTATVNVLVVSSLPGITGPGTVCVGTNTTLTNGITGGTWTSGDAYSITGLTSGIVTGLSTGTTVITYSLGLTCTITTELTVDPAPAHITGTNYACLGLSATLSNTDAGGTWSASNGNATIGSATGLVTTVSSGLDTIGYTHTANGCVSTVVFSVNALPARFSLTGGGSYCYGGTGVDIGSTSSQPGVNYQLHILGTGITTSAIAGTGSSLDFGPQTLAGSYVIVAINTATSCANIMADTAVITIVPLVEPSVSLTSSAGTAICTGTLSIFTATPTNGGAAPMYQWKINSTDIPTAVTDYTYFPVNGDTVSVTMISNAACASYDTTAASIVMMVRNHYTPGIGIFMTPMDSVCSGTPTIFTAVDSFGGIAPGFVWTRNGIVVSGGPAYLFTPEMINNGDLIACKMSSSLVCRTIDTVQSNQLTLKVDTVVVPLVTIHANPGTSILAGDSITFTVTVVNGGAAPQYQWLYNGVPVAGETNTTYTRDSFTTNDSVSCEVLGSGACAVSSFNSVVIHVTVVGISQVSGTAGDIRLIPNPNKGSFSIRGTLGTTTDEEVSYEITDMLGQVVYKNKLVATGGKINESVLLKSNLANGMYMLNLHSENENKVFHFVIEQ